MAKPRVLIIGAGPAGLTAACELSDAGVTDVTVLEATQAVGGLAQSVEFKGNRIDIGGHRFFSKSDWVLDWWLRMLPLAPGMAEEARAHGLSITYQGMRRGVVAPPESPHGAMLVRNRLSRIYFDGKFFDYPLKVDVDTALKLGIARCAAFGASYLWSTLFPRRPESTLEDFFINRFGRRLYLQFFKAYTEKVWGTSCDRISAEWGAQRVKSLSVGKALRHALRRALRRPGTGAAEQTSLIERFLYPMHGPGQMWEAAAARLRQRGVRIELGAAVRGIEHDGRRVTALAVATAGKGESRLQADGFLSTMPVRDLVLGLEPTAPQALREIAAGLEYRDFVIIGLLYRRLLPTPAGCGPQNLVPDNWIYVQESGVQVGRLQFFNNWSPHLVRDPGTVWVGMEYFCREGDELWRLPDAELLRLGVEEMAKLRLADPADRLDGVVIRMPKAYPGYYGTYARFGELREYLDGFANLYLIGRNGMHRYNNQDHSMLSAKLAVQALLAGSGDKAAIWAVNVDDEYHEEASR